MDSRLHQEQEYRDLAKGLGLAPKQLLQHLAVLGWDTLKHQAELHANNKVEEGAAAKPGYHLLEAAQTLLYTAGKLPKETQASVEKGPGYIYVLFDGVTKQAKIGCTKNDGQRQRAIMGAHSNVLANVLNARVNDMFAAETQCHRHFAAFRKNGEWFDAELEDIINYIAQEVEWEALSLENMARMAQYIVACRLGDMEMAKFALTGPNFPVPEV
jgi:hypothetical protein